MESPFFVAKYNQHKEFLKCSKFLEGTVVDIGCGKMPFKKYLPDRDYVGVDDSFTADIKADATKIPLEDGYADAVICSEVLEHLPQPILAVREIRRLLKAGGHAYITVPMYWPLHYQPRDFWRFTNFSLMTIMAQYDFKIKYMNRYGGLNFFIACRISETVYNLFRKLFSEKISLILLAPIQVILWGYAKLDKFNKRDTAGWVLLAERR